MQAATPPSAPARSRLRAIAGLALVAAAVLAYWNSLGTPFHFDDEPAVVDTHHPLHAEQ